jgi:hypothetical protein
MSIQSMYPKLPLFLVPSKLAKAPVSQGDNQPPQNLQRSGKLKVKDDVLKLPPLLTKDVLRQLYPVDKIPDDENAYLAYFKDRFCDTKSPFYTPLSTRWGAKVDPIALRDNSPKKAFEHITFQKPTKEDYNRATTQDEMNAIVPVFNPLRAMYLSWLQKILSTQSTKWYKAFIGETLSPNRLLGLLTPEKAEAYPLLVIIEKRKYEEAKFDLVSLYPKNYSRENIRESDFIKHPENYFDQGLQNKNENIQQIRKNSFYSLTDPISKREKRRKRYA